MAHPVPSPVRAPTRRPHALTVLAAAALVGLVAAACGGDGDDAGDLAAFCSLVEEELITLESPFQALERGDPEEIEAALTEVDRLLGELVDVAPTEVRDESRTLAEAVDEVIEVLEDTDYDVAAANAALAESDLVTPERTAELRQASETLDRFASEQCDLPETTTTPSTAPPAG